MAPSFSPRLASGFRLAGFAIVQWWWGEPEAASAVRHFDDFTPALAALAMGSLAWMYHRPQGMKR